MTTESKIKKRLDSQLKKWREHNKKCGHKDCITIQQELEYIRSGRNTR